MQDINEQEELNTDRRKLLGGFGLLSGLISACSETMPHTRNGQEQVLDPRCGCMPPGATPPTTPPAAPPAGAPAAPGTGAVAPQNPAQLGSAFSSIGPSAATLTVSDMMTGGITLSDGAVVPAWSFASGGAGFNGDRLMPGPVVECLEGAPMALTLSTMMAHTIHLHGLDVDTANDGVPSTSFYVVGTMMGGPIPPNMLPPTIQNDAARASPFTYNFTPRFAGTYMYHCHVDTVLHMEMGMWGTIIVRPADGSRNTVWTGGPTFSKEYVWHLHTMDTTWHSQTQSSSLTARYHPNYFMINGKDGANLLTDPATVLTAAAGERVLLRLVNPGYLPAMVNLGNQLFEVVSSDGRPLVAPMMTTTLLVGPGERYDVILSMPATASAATVSYYNITGLSILGSATTSITPA